MAYGHFLLCLFLFLAQMCFYLLISCLNVCCFSYFVDFFGVFTLFAELLVIFCTEILQLIYESGTTPEPLSRGHLPAPCFKTTIDLTTYGHMYSREVCIFHTFQHLVSSVHFGHPVVRVRLYPWVAKPLRGLLFCLFPVFMVHGSAS